MAEPRIDWVALSKVLSAGGDPAGLDVVTRAEYDRAAAEANAAGEQVGQPVEPTEADQAATQFWADVVAFEADAAPIVAELGEGTLAHQQFIEDMNAMGRA
jgi:hypothetical protein